MEPKKLKKLVLKKDVISKLKNQEMNQMRGGASNNAWAVPGCILDSEKSFCPSACNCPSAYGYQCDYGGGGANPTGSCADANTCATCGPVPCYGGYENTWPHTQCGGSLCNYL